MNQKSLKLGMGFVGLFALAALSLGQPIRPVAVKTGVRPVTESTLSFSPQIQSARSAHREIENIFGSRPVPTGPANSLRAGGLLPATSGHTVFPKAQFPSIGYTGSEPPDPDLGVGPNHVVSTVNVSIAFHRKDGFKQFEQGLERFFQSVGAGSFVFDPKSFYDPVSRRFYVVALDVNFTAKTSAYLLAVSDDADPNGNWFKYKIDNKAADGTVEYWVDYPGFGHNKDSVVLTGNLFGFDSGFGGISFLHLSKAQLMAGQAPTLTFFRAPGGSVQVMRGPDTTSSHIYLANFASSSQLRVWAINTTGTPTLQGTNVAVPNFQNPRDWVISTGGRFLDPLDGRLMNVFYRNGRLYATHTIHNAALNTNQSRWYEVNIGTWPMSGAPTLRQSGNVGGSANQHIWMPAIAVNRSGDIALIASRTSTSVAPEMVITFRRPTDPMGAMSSPRFLVGSAAPAYGGFSYRWGDYFGLSVDPNDDQTFWGIGMVAGPGNGAWQTHVNSFRVTTPTALNIDAITRFEGRASSGTVAEARTSDNRYFTVSSAKVNRVGEVASATVDATIPAGMVESVQVQAELQGVAGTSVSYFAYDWAKQTYVFLGSSPLSTTDTVSSPRLTTSFMNAQRKVRYLIRAVNPTNTSRTGAPFTFKIDRASLTALILSQ